MSEEKPKVVLLTGDNPAFREKLKSLIEASGLEVANESDSKRVLLVEDDCPRLDPIVFKTLEREDLDAYIGIQDNQPWYNRFRKNKY